MLKPEKISLLISAEMSSKALLGLRGLNCKSRLFARAKPRRPAGESVHVYDTPFSYLKCQTVETLVVSNTPPCGSLSRKKPLTKNQIALRDRVGKEHNCCMIAHSYATGMREPPQRPEESR